MQNDVGSSQQPTDPIELPTSTNDTAGGSMGKFENAPVYMWDWYTSNGAVTFSDFVRPPVVP